MRRLTGPSAMTGIALLAVALTASAVLARGGPAQAKVLGPNGRIAFVRVLDSVAVETPQRATYTVDPDGTNVKQLPLGTAPDPGPVWSPEGTEILVFSSECPTSGSVECQVIINVDTGDLRELPIPDPAFSACLPGSDCGNAFWGCGRWSPNGTRLACVGSSEVEPSLTGIYTVRSSDFGGLRLVTHKLGALGDYSPDGKRLVFEAEDGDGGVALFTIRLDGTGLHQITPPGMLLNGSMTEGGSWSPSGTKILTWARSDDEHRFSIWIVNADGSGVHQIPISGCGGLSSDPNSIGCRRPVWSPDGTKIVFERRSLVGTFGPVGTFDIYKANADGSGLSPVVRNGLDEGLPDWGTHPLTP